MLTGLEFERLVSASGPTGGKPHARAATRKGEGGYEPEKVAFIHCVGSRDKSVGNEYCSRVCCMYLAKQAHLIKDKLPDAEITVFYMDVRAFGKGFEEFYDRVRREGVRYVRGNPSEIYKQGRRPHPGREGRGHPDRHPPGVRGRPGGAGRRAGAAPGHTGRSSTCSSSRSPSDGFFLEAHPKLRPVDTASDGVFLAGCCQGPKDIPDTVAQAKGAASSALILMAYGKVKVEAQISVVIADECRGCGFCVEVCPFGAIELVEENRMGNIVKVARVNEALCKGCGSCAAACLSGAIQPQVLQGLNRYCHRYAVLGVK